MRRELGGAGSRRPRRAHSAAIRASLRRSRPILCRRARARRSCPGAVGCARALLAARRRAAALVAGRRPSSRPARSRRALPRRREPERGREIEPRRRARGGRSACVCSPRHVAERPDVRPGAWPRFYSPLDLAEPSRGHRPGCGAAARPLAPAAARHCRRRAGDPRDRRSALLAERELRGVDVPGANDNASGAAIVAQLAAELRRRAARSDPRRAC